MKEWVITNGIGGFASTTDKGINERRYHGLLIAATNPPGLRKLILSKVDESIDINGKRYNLYANKSNCGKVTTDGYKYIKKFEKNVMPVYTYKVGTVVIEKTICMLHGKNTVAIIYRVSNQKAKVKLSLTPVVNFRDFHSENHELEFDYIQKVNRDRVELKFKEGKINLCVSGASYKEHSNDIFYDMYYEKEKIRGFDYSENHAVPGTFEIDIKPNEDKEITFLCSLDGEYGNSIEELPRLSGAKIIENEQKRIEKLIASSNLLHNLPTKDEERESYTFLTNQYITSADNFLVKRAKTNLSTIIAGYPWFLDWGRDTLIAFEGICLIPKRYEEAKEVLLTLTTSIKEGLVPNGFDEYDGHPLYNSVDASLLLFEGVEKYIEYTNDYEFVKEKIYSKLINIVDHYLDGINLDKNNIKCDEKTFLISAGTESTQNTWMDAKVNGTPVTPRNGFAVEVNAMWYNALKILQELSKKYMKFTKQAEYAIIAKRCKKSFIEKFYNPEKKCLYDVLGDDSVRPNQLLALSLTYPVLDCDKDMAKETFITVTQTLLNKYGLQTLAKGEKNYVPIYKGTPEERDMVYHQGITWPWLLGEYYNGLKNMIKAEKNIVNKRKLENTLLQFKSNVASTFIKELIDGNTIGSICEIYDSIPNSQGKGAFAQAWSVSEVFRILFG